MKNILKIFRRVSLLAVAVTASVLLFAGGSAQAATNGRMIDDSVFDASGSMSATDIQNFLNGFPNSCLKNYTDDMPSSDPTRAYFDYSGTGSAAQIIRRVADNYGINPRVLLTKLEQESSLVSGGSGCALWRQASAVGFKCYDGANLRTTVFRGTTIQTCVATDADMGVARQLSRGGWLLKWAKERANGNLNWLVPDDATYTYNGPMTQGNKKRCGTCSTIYYDGYWNGVYLESGATASLYNYTPYLNQAFDEIWEGWWGAGSTVGVPYRWSFNGQAAYTDSSKASPVDINNLSPGQNVWLVVRATNTGNTTWSNIGVNRVSLVTDRSFARISRFADNTWRSPTTPTDLKEETVLPGQTGTFEFQITIPPGGGSFREYFNPIVQNKTILNNDVGQYFQLTVKSGYSWNFGGQAAYADSSKQNQINLQSVRPGETAWLVLRATNTGSATWYKTGPYQVNIVTDRSIGRVSRFATGAWLSPNTPGRLTESSVAPNQTGTFEFPITIPNDMADGGYAEYFNPVAQNIAYLNNNIGQHFSIFVNTKYHWAFSSQAAYTDSSKATPVNLGSMQPGQTAWLVLRATNNGTATWVNSGVNRVSLVTDRSFSRTSRFASGLWLSPNTPVNLKEVSVAPNQTGTFEFPIQVPVGAGTYKEYFNPIVQGIAPMNNDAGQYFQITVN